MSSTDCNFIFAGTPALAAYQLQEMLKAGYRPSLVITSPDKKQGRGRKLQPTAVKKVALDASIPVIQPKTLNGDDCFEEIKRYKPSLMIVVAYGQLIPKDLLALPKLGCLNLHLSLLPRWRGASPINQAILAGDQTTGVTLMQMDAGLDTGAILAQSPCNIEAAETALTLEGKLSTLGAKLLIAHLPDILAGKITPVAQEHTQANYAKKIQKKQGLVNWEHSAIDIDRAIRAYQPWPICYSFINSRRLRLWQAKLASAENISPPGTINQTSPSSITVQTGNGQLEILCGQWEGGKPLPLSQLLNAGHHSLQVGAQFHNEEN